MRVEAGPDAAVTRLHASTRRPDIGGTVPYDSSLLRHCACCRNQHNGGNYKNILPHSLSSSFCTPDMHGLTPGNQVGFCPTTTFQLLCASGPGASGAAASGLFAASASLVTPFVTSRAPLHHAVRGVLCAAHRRRSIPLVWASTSDTVSTVAGTARANAAVTPKRENAVRREISSDLSFSVIFKSPLSSLLFVPSRLALRERETATNSAFEGEADVSSAANSVSSSGEGASERLLSLHSPSCARMANCLGLQLADQLDHGPTCDRVDVSVAHVCFSGDDIALTCRNVRW